MKVVNCALNIKRRLNRSLFDQPSFYIAGESRLGRNDGIWLKVLNKENAYFIVEKVLFKTEDGAVSELKYENKISKLTINLPDEDQYFGVSGVIVIEYRLKNKSSFSATSPKIVTREMYNEKLGKEIPLNIMNEIQIQEVNFT